jgi:hypothetical protein
MNSAVTCFRPVKPAEARRAAAAGPYLHSHAVNAGLQVQSPFSPNFRPVVYESVRPGRKYLYEIAIRYHPHAPVDLARDRVIVTGRAACKSSARKDAGAEPCNTFLRELSRSSAQKWALGCKVRGGGRGC